MLQNYGDESGAALDNERGGLDDQGLPSDAAILAYLQKSQTDIGPLDSSTVATVPQQPQSTASTSSSLPQPLASANDGRSDDTSLLLRLLNQIQAEGAQPQQEHQQQHFPGAKPGPQGNQGSQQQLASFMAQLEPIPLPERLSSGLSTLTRPEFGEQYMREAAILLRNYDSHCSDSEYQGSASIIPIPVANSEFGNVSPALYPFDSDLFSTNDTTGSFPGMSSHPSEMISFLEADQTRTGPPSNTGSSVGAASASSSWLGRLSKTNFRQLAGTVPSSSGHSISEPSIPLGLMSQHSIRQGSLGTPNHGDFRATWSDASTEALDDLGTTSLVKEKTSRPKKAKHDSKPKRPLSAYNLFFSEERERILEEIPDKASVAPHASQIRPRKGKPRPHGKIDFQSLAKMVGKRWKDLDAETVAIYKQKAADDLARYRNEMVEYVKTIGKEEELSRDD
jgi:hypothetical protein